MKRGSLIFKRPPELQASGPLENRGRRRDEVRLMVSTPQGHRHGSFVELPEFLPRGALLVANRSSMLPASLPARSSAGPFILNLATRFAPDLWLAEPRRSPGEAGPLPFTPDEPIEVGDLNARIGAVYPGLPRLSFVRFDGPAERTIDRFGQPIRYGYLEPPYPALSEYQTIFGDTPGSAEMPSAGRPFTSRVIDALSKRDIRIHLITLHTGVSSLEVESEDMESLALPPEPFHVPDETATAVNAARREGRPVIAIGTTVVRALESAWKEGSVQPTKGFTRLVIHPGRGVNVVDGLITGLHDPLTSHLAMLHTIGGERLIRSAYSEAIAREYRWHEFGDIHAILPG